MHIQSYTYVDLIKTHVHIQSRYKCPIKTMKAASRTCMIQMGSYKNPQSH